VKIRYTSNVLLPRHLTWEGGMRERFVKAVVCLFIAGMCFGKSYATIIVSGDVLISFALNPSFFSGKFFNPDNQRFFTNVLDGETNIAIVMQPEIKVGDIVTNPTNESYANKLNYFYKNIASKTTSMISTITASSLENVGMLFAPMLSTPFSPGELLALNDFIDSGGSVFFLGESDMFSDQNKIINQTLAGIGSSLRIVDGNLDNGKGKAFLASGSQIVNSGYTSGMSSFLYGAVSGVSGGTPLFYSTGGVPFVEYEEISRVSEPAISASMLIGLLFISGLFSRKRKD
jgi:hypothetical protein